MTTYLLSDNSFKKEELLNLGGHGGSPDGQESNQNNMKTQPEVPLLELVGYVHNFKPVKPAWNHSAIYPAK